MLSFRLLTPNKTHGMEDTMTQKTNLTNQELYQQRVFDEKAENYDSQAITFGGRDNRNHAIKATRINELLRPESEDSILEIGVGSGLHADWLLKQNANIYYTGIDISSKLIENTGKLLSNFGERARLQQDNANDLSFSDGTFNGVFCAATLHHMEEPGHTIKEMARVLKPGGRFVLMEPNWIYPTNIGFMIFLKEDRHMFLMRRNKILKWMADAGLEQCRVGNLLYTPPKPEFMIPFYNLVDKAAALIPGIRRISLMLSCSAVKPS
jgi:ubiquinone/menaquinone biosynthesis C-methylase UbiE